MIKRQKQMEQFSKFTAYMLGRRPDEFGLVPDKDGYVKIKEYLKAVTETDGFHHIRKNHINEMLLVINPAPVELSTNLIRAVDRSKLPEYIPCIDLPKLFFICISQKAYNAVLSNGLRPTFFEKIICSSNPSLAEKIGRRRDSHPVLLTVHIKKTKEHGVIFFHSGELLFLTDYIPVDCFTCPPLPKEIPAKKIPDPIEIYKKQTRAGTFHLSMVKKYGDKKPDDKKSEKSYKDKKKAGDLSWKNNKKKFRKEKKRFQDDF
ncbi:MAG: RNA 2'-phosphotransferase [Dissulfuribacterales bacterium]